MNEPVYSDQADAWLRSIDEEAARAVIQWVRERFGHPGEGLNRSGLAVVEIRSPSGQGWEIAEIPGMGIAITWLVAHPFQTVKVIYLAWVSDLDLDGG